MKPYPEFIINDEERIMYSIPSEEAHNAILLYYEKLEDPDEWFDDLDLDGNLNVETQRYNDLKVILRTFYNG